MKQKLFKIKAKYGQEDIVAMYFVKNSAAAIRSFYEHFDAKYLIYAISVVHIPYSEEFSGS